MGGDASQVPDQTGPREGAEEVVGDVDFPPIESLAHGMGEAVVIVVPAFSEGDEGEDEAVAAVVSCFEALTAEGVGQGVDEEGGVEEDDGAHHEAPHE